MIENSLISLYCIIDDFIHSFLKTPAGKKHLALYYGNRGPKCRMAVVDVVTLNLIRIFDKTGDLKTFHKTVREYYISYSPMLTNYENFLKATNKAAGFIGAFVQYQLYLNRLHCTEIVFYVDSTPISVLRKPLPFLSQGYERTCGQGKILKRMVFRLQIAGNLHGRRHTGKTLLPSGQRT